MQSQPAGCQFFNLLRATRHHTVSAPIDRQPSTHPAWHSTSAWGSCPRASRGARSTTPGAWAGPCAGPGPGGRCGGGGVHSGGVVSRPGHGQTRGRRITSQEVVAHHACDRPNPCFTSCHRCRGTGSSGPGRTGARAGRAPASPRPSRRASPGIGLDLVWVGVSIDRYRAGSSVRPTNQPPD